MVQLYSDFNCPFCFIQFERITELEVKPEYCFIEHAPELVTQLNTPEQLDQLAQEYATVCRRSPDARINQPTFCVNTRLAILHYYSLLAQDKALAAQFATKIYRAYWLNNQDISQQDVLTALLQELGVQNLSIDTAATKSFRKNQHFWINGDMEQRIPAMRCEQSGLLLGLQHRDTIDAFIDGKAIDKVHGDACSYTDQQQVALINLPELSDVFSSVHSDYQVTHFDSVTALLSCPECTAFSAVFLRIGELEYDQWHGLSTLKNSLLNKYLPVIAVTGSESQTLVKQGFLLGATDVLKLESIDETFLPCLASRISNYHTLVTLADFALVDGLTGIYNKRTYMQALHRKWRKSMRDKLPFSIVLMDVDDFKAYNDIYGHLAGDQCLKQLAAVFQQQLQRPEDLAARFGGEEFCFLLPDTDAEGAGAVLEKVMSHIAQAGISHKGSSVKGVETVTLSCGVVTCVANPDISVNHVLEIADQALYRAKAAGKNTAIFDTFNLD